MFPVYIQSRDGSAQVAKPPVVGSPWIFPHVKVRKEAWDPLDFA